MQRTVEGHRNITPREEASRGGLHHDDRPTRRRGEELCRALVRHLDVDSSRAEVQRVLGPLLTSGRLKQQEQEEQLQNEEAATAALDDDDDDDLHSRVASAPRLTPLLLACDRGQVETVRFLLEHQQQRNHQQRSVVGSLTDRAPDSLNTVFHYACLRNDDDDDRDDESSSSLALLRLLVSHDDGRSRGSPWYARVNAHGDTPLHMAAATGATRLVEEYCTTTTHRHHTAVTATRNLSDDNVVSLAAAHGHVDIVRRVLDVDVVRTDEDDAVVRNIDLDRAREAWRRTERFAQRLVLEQRRQGGEASSPALPQRIQRAKQKAHDMGRCVQLIQDVLQRRADAAAASLWETHAQEEDFSHDDNNNNNNKKSSKAKRSRGKQPRRSKSSPKTSVDNPTPTTNNHTQREKKKKDDTSAEEVSSTSIGLDNENDDTGTPFLKRLDDGTRAVVVPGRIDTTVAREDKAITTNKNNHDTASVSPTPSRVLTGHHHDEDALRALSLADPRWPHAFLSSHGMTLHCSAAQLDCLETVLRRQLRTVHEARVIQRRLHATAEAGEPGNK